MQEVAFLNTVERDIYLEKQVSIMSCDEKRSCPHYAIVRMKGHI